jgi:predicted Rossmann fold nucleotide-binding protein DprA/Smf involved in DNA uptake
MGGAHLVTDAADVLSVLEGPARHAFNGTHASRFPAAGAEQDDQPRDLFPSPAEAPASRVAGPTIGLTEAQQRIVDALRDPRTLDDLVAATGLDVSRLRVDLTQLELMRRITRAGTRFARR